MLWIVIHGKLFAVGDGYFLIQSNTVICAFVTIDAKWPMFFWQQSLSLVNWRNTALLLVSFCKSTRCWRGPGQAYATAEASDGKYESVTPSLQSGMIVIFQLSSLLLLEQKKENTLFLRMFWEKVGYCEKSSTDSWKLCDSEQSSVLPPALIFSLQPIAASQFLETIFHRSRSFILEQGKGPILGTRQTSVVCDSPHNWVRRGLRY